MKEKGADYVWFDGEFVKWEEAKIPIMTHALHYGTAVFEGIRAYGTQDNLYVFRLEDHMARLHQSARFYSMTNKYSVKELCDITVDLLKKNNFRSSCYIRPLHFVGLHGIDLNVGNASPTQIAIIVFPFARYFPTSGIKACISSWRRIHDSSTPPMAKAAGNYLNSILATQESKRNGYDEAILLDIDGNISEASGENIFVVRNNTMITPNATTSALEGITRDTAINIAKNLGIPVSERPLSRSELYISDEVFLTGTAAEIIAITHIDGHKIGTGFEGKITRTIRETYSEIVNGKIDQFSNWLTQVW